MDKVIVCGAFDDLRSHHIRFLDRAAKLGKVQVLLWSDETVGSITGKPPKFPMEERVYILKAIRYVDRISPIYGSDESEITDQIEAMKPDIWIVNQAAMSVEQQDLFGSRGISPIYLDDYDLSGFSDPGPLISAGSSGYKKVVVTGCFDWLHSGHVRFFEEVSQLGSLYVMVGHDANVRLLKGAGHPLFPQEERRYMVGSIRHVEQAMITSGQGWMDAEPEIDQLKPDMYVVNEDGDQPEKQTFCEERGIRYVVLARLPKEGLQRRESTNLRGF
jgi:cytidyltransferase-like protein